MKRVPEPEAARVPADVLAARRRSEVLVTAERVEHAVAQLAVRLSLAFQDRNPWLLAVMHGALPFAGALIPRLTFPLQLGHLHVSRYGDATRGGGLTWHAEPNYPLEGRTVLLLDDVLDQGETLRHLEDWAVGAGAREVHNVVLVDKDVAAERPVTAGYAALRCPDRYLFGFGMDYRGYWRNLDAIYALPEDMEDV